MDKNDLNLENIMHKWKFIFILSIIRASTEFILYLGAVLSVEEKCACEALSLSLEIGVVVLR
jgi:hypothetical protein